uniref:Thiopurine S-methyltransferase n=1 Tax=Hucho hucho TaxID=62062 RepID=A0A4W5NJF3_9TELE
RMLESYIDKVLCGRKEVQFFFPLWESYMGHSVVGVDIAEMGIRQFFEDQKLIYSEEVVPAIPGAKVYRDSDGKIYLYQCDLYKFSSHRGSLVAINPRDREKYAALIMSSMDKACRYLLDTFLYNSELFKGKIFPEKAAQMIFVFHLSCDIEFIQSSDALPDVKHKEWGFDVFIERVHLFTPKTS